MPFDFENAPLLGGRPCDQDGCYSMVEIAAKIEKVKPSHYYTAAAALECSSPLHVAPYTVAGSYPSGERWILWMRDNFSEDTTAPERLAGGFRAYKDLNKVSRGRMVGGGKNQ